jgi:glucose-6-phosphate-specific signal transduction histidine kinase
MPVVLIVGAWGLGLAARSIRAERGDERVVGDAGWEAGEVDRDRPARDALVRDLRDLIERSMSTVVLRSRAARAALRREPARAEQALAAIEAAGTEALLETQRLTGLLLSPDGAQLTLAPNGLRDLDELTVQVADAGLPVSTRIEGRPVPLSPDLDGVAFRVIHAALLNALDGTVDGEASVVVRYGREELQVEVTDDGSPIEGGSQEGADGLLAVRDEVAALGGTLDAGPGEERGYWVLARLPYEPDDLA